MNSLNGSINGNVSSVTREELLGQLDSDNLDLFQDLLEELERPDVNVEAVKVWFEFESARRNRTKSHQKPAPASPATEQAETPTERETDPTNIPSVHTIARHVFARMLTNEVGETLFPLGLSDLHLNFDVVGAFYGDIVEAIIAGLAGTDADELRRAACFGSAR